MRNNLVTDGIYHIVNRGVEDRVIFQNKRDYERFLLTILECNSLNSISIGKNRHRRNQNKRNNIQSSKDDKLIEILAFSLMPNHFHFAVKQLVDSGVAKFMQRICGSYAKYFNIKKNRKGPLFISRYKSIHVKTDLQMRHLITYIHANPLDLVMPAWRLGKIKDFKKAKEFLENYQWSSYPLYARNGGLDLVGQIINKETTGLFYPNREDYFEAISSWSNRYFESFDADLESE